MAPVFSGCTTAFSLSKPSPLGAKQYSMTLCADSKTAGFCLRFGGTAASQLAQSPQRMPDRICMARMPCESVARWISPLFKTEPQNAFAGIPCAESGTTYGSFCSATHAPSRACIRSTPFSYSACASVAQCGETRSIFISDIRHFPLLVVVARVVAEPVARFWAQLLGCAWKHFLESKP